MGLAKLDKALDDNDKDNDDVDVGDDDDGGGNEKGRGESVLVAAGPLSCFNKSVDPGLHRGRAAAAGPVIARIVEGGGGGGAVGVHPVQVCHVGGGLGKWQDPSQPCSSSGTFSCHTDRGLLGAWTLSRSRG